MLHKISTQNILPRCHSVQGYDELPELSHKESWGLLFNCILSQAFPICSLVTNHNTKVSWQLEFLLNIITEIVKLWFLSVWPDLDGSLQVPLPLPPLPRATQQIYQVCLSLIPLNFLFLSIRFFFQKHSPPDLSLDQNGSVNQEEIQPPHLCHTQQLGICVCVRREITNLLCRFCFVLKNRWNSVSMRKTWLKFYSAHCKVQSLGCCCGFEPFASCFSLISPDPHTSFPATPTNPIFCSDIREESSKSLAICQWWLRG